MPLIIVCPHGTIGPNDQSAFGNFQRMYVNHIMPPIASSPNSIYGLVGAPDVPPYHASKGAIRLMSKTDALLYAPDRIRVNSVHPGFIWTSMVENYLKTLGDIETGRKAVDALHPLGHMGEVDDIAWGVVYLASDESKFVTGTELVIDGGYTAR